MSNVINLDDAREPEVKGTEVNEDAKALVEEAKVQEPAKKLEPAVVSYKGVRVSIPHPATWNTGATYRLMKIEKAKDTMEQTMLLIDALSLVMTEEDFDALMRLELEDFSKVFEAAWSKFGVSLGE